MPLDVLLAARALELRSRLGDPVERSAPHSFARTTPSIAVP